MFSKATEYALRATIFIAQSGSAENKVRLEDISKAIGSPVSFTAKILQALRKDNRIIQSVSGPNGGFYITDQGLKLPVKAVLEAMGEYDVLERCVLGLNECSEEQPCPMHSRYKVIKKQLIKLFETESIGALAEGMKKGDVFIRNWVEKKHVRK